MIDAPDARIQEPTDAVIRITSTALCGSDLHLDDVLGPFPATDDDRAAPGPAGREATAG